MRALLIAAARSGIVDVAVAGFGVWFAANNSRVLAIRAKVRSRDALENDTLEPDLLLTPEVSGSSSDTACAMVFVAFLVLPSGSSDCASVELCIVSESDAVDSWSDIASGKVREIREKRGSSKPQARLSNDYILLKTHGGFIHLERGKNSARQPQRFQGGAHCNMLT